jgi:hypothetical protein
MPAAQAATYVPAFEIIKTTTTTVANGPTLLGYRFATDIDKVIKAIGVYKTITSPPNNRLGIWDFNDLDNPVLLFQTVITTAGDCTGDFCWYPASDFLPTLLPEIKKDNLYAIATAWGNEKVPAGIEPSDIKIVSPGFSVGVSAYNFDEQPLASLDVDLCVPPASPTPAGCSPPSSSVFAPTETDNSVRKSYFTANLSFETYDSTKVPTPLPLFGAAAAFGLSRKIRLRISSST